MKDLGQPREEPALSEAEGSRSLRQNNRAFGSLPFQTDPLPAIFSVDENPASYGIIAPMAAETDSLKPAGMVPDEFKFEPKSKGLLTPRKKKPKELAVITECCTGCAGSPACVEYCPVEDCMFWVPDEDHPPFGRIQVDPILCIGCKKCLSKGPDGCFLDGCPWDAIVMVDTVEVEKEVGVMPI